jgi:hypothetical protein
LHGYVLNVATEIRPEAPTLTALDRCDRCGAQAFVRVEMRSGELLFCGHHSREHAGAYKDKATRIQDETTRLQLELGAR